MSDFVDFHYMAKAFGIPIEKMALKNLHEEQNMNKQCYNNKCYRIVSTSSIAPSILSCKWR